MNKTKPAIDRVARDAMAAKAAGLSYGQYKARIYERQQAEKKAKPEVKVEKPIVTGQRKRPYCAICGGLIPKESTRRKYCSQRCADIAMHQYHLT